MSLKFSHSDLEGTPKGFANTSPKELGGNSLGGNVLVAQSCSTLCDPMNCSPQAPLSMKFSRQEYWSGLPFPYPGDLPDPGIEPESPALQADFFTV